MEFDDYMEPQVAVAVAATAALFSPRVRGVLRRGLVYGVAGALTAGEAVTSFGRGLSHGVEEAASSVRDMGPGGGEEPSEAGS